MHQDSLSKHLSNAVKARWARMTPEARSAYAYKMLEARRAKRAAKEQNGN